MRTNKQIVEECNDLANTFARMHGHIDRPEFKYYKATHPQEALFWEMALAAYDHIEGTDVDGALEEMEY